MAAAPTGKPRHVPQRTCIACRQEAGKRSLVRVVRTPDQRVAVDPSGKANGRGAYVHANRACWEKALKGATMKNALKITLAAEDVLALRAFGDALPAEESEAP
ncbi:MAG: RNase P modulator RnpM [Hyphomicrobiaceae bacterium]